MITPSGVDICYHDDTLLHNRCHGDNYRIRQQTDNPSSKLRVATDNVGLAKLREGTELVRWHRAVVHPDWSTARSA